MPIVGLAVGSTRPHESKYDPDRGTPNATKWLIHTLDSRVMGHLKDRATTMKVDPNRPDDTVDTVVNMEAVKFETVQFGVTWENFADPKGGEIACDIVGRRLASKSYKIAHEDGVAQIPGAILEELAAEVRKDNDLDLEELGNSDGP